MTGERGASGSASALLFFVLPILVLAGAIGLRTTGRVESATGIVARLSTHLAAARAAALSEDVPLELVLAVAAAESAGRADARSHRDAVGLMQLRPGTASDMAARGREPPPDLLDPAVSLRLGARYLAIQRRRFRDHPLGEELALCAYNAGPANVTGWMKSRPPSPVAATLGSWIPFTETRNYVRRVAAWRARWAEILAAETPESTPTEPAH